MKKIYNIDIYVFQSACTCLLVVFCLFVCVCIYKYARMTSYVSVHTCISKHIYTNNTHTNAQTNESKAVNTSALSHTIRARAHNNYRSAQTQHNLESPLPRLKWVSAAWKGEGLRCSRTLLSRPKSVVISTLTGLGECGEVAAEHWKLPKGEGPRLVRIKRLCDC